MHLLLIQKQQENQDITSVVGFFNDKDTFSKTLLRVTKVCGEGKTLMVGDYVKVRKLYVGINPNASRQDLNDSVWVWGPVTMDGLDIYDTSKSHSIKLINCGEEVAAVDMNPVDDDNDDGEAPINND